MLTGNPDCEDDTVHITSVQRSRTGDLKTVTETCPADLYPQACAHYYSASYEGKAKSLLTCEDYEKRDNAEATEEWKKEHNSGDGWDAFTKPIYLFRGEKKDVDCQADEWPPGYFLPHDREARKKPEWGHLIRWLPSQENGQAANTLWTSFCRKYDGGEGNGQRLDVNKKPGNAYRDKPSEQVPVNEDLVNLGKSRVESAEKDGTWTHTTYLDEVTFTRAVRALSFDYNEANKPRKGNDWYLSENPGWPNHIVPDIPGFVLRTNDKRYGTHQFPQGYDASKTKALYADDPPTELVQQAELRLKQSGDQDTGEKRGHSPDGSDGNQKRSEKLELVDHLLVLRDDAINTTRRLTENDMHEQVEVIQCSDRACSNERKQYDEARGFVFVPGSSPPSKPAGNVAMPTAASTFATSLVKASLDISLPLLRHAQETGSVRMG